MNCAICNLRKPRRHCPGINGDICTVCCGTERERTIDCPLDCVYLQDAHQHEKPADIDPASVPNQDIEVTEEFLHANEVLMALLSVALVEGTAKNPSTTDWDMREALQTLVEEFRSNPAVSLPANPNSAAIVESVREKISDITRREAEATGKTTVRPQNLLPVVVFLQRLEYSRNNTRKFSRSFLDFLRSFYVPGDLQPEEEIVDPDSSGVI